MRNRLQQILDYYNINSSRLADKLGVQRSGISHILSGRNKPGFDFLKGILDLYPEIDANWLITGKGDMLKQSVMFDENAERPEPHQDSGTLFDKELSKKDENPVIKSSDNTEKDSDYKSKHNIDAPLDIQSVILLLKNGKFRAYEEE